VLATTGFLVGSVLGAMALGVGLEGVASLLPARSQHSSLIVFGVVSAPLLVADVRSRGAFSPIGWSRQTCASWVHARRYLLVSLAWGVDLGLGVTTFRVSSTYWIALLGCLLFVPPAAIPAILAIYAVILTASIAVTALRLSRESCLSSSLTNVSRKARLVVAGLSLALIALMALA
jgi:hypothetical protein